MAAKFKVGDEVKILEDVKSLTSPHVFRAGEKAEVARLDSNEQIERIKCQGHTRYLIDADCDNSKFELWDKPSDPYATGKWIVVCRSEGESDELKKRYNSHHHWQQDVCMTLVDGAYVGWQSKPKSKDKGHYKSGLDYYKGEGFEKWGYTFVEAADVLAGREATPEGSYLKLDTPIDITDDIDAKVTISAEPIKKPKKPIMKTVTTMMKKLLDTDTQELVKAGLINGDLELTERGSDELEVIMFTKFKTELVAVAKEINKEEEKK